LRKRWSLLTDAKWWWCRWLRWTYFSDDEWLLEKEHINFYTTDLPNDKNYLHPAVAMVAVEGSEL
jgi:hypothetical protein